MLIFTLNKKLMLLLIDIVYYIYYVIKSNMSNILVIRDRRSKHASSFVNELTSKYDFSFDIGWSLYNTDTNYDMVLYVVTSMSVGAGTVNLANEKLFRNVLDKFIDIQIVVAVMYIGDYDPGPNDHNRLWQYRSWLPTYKNYRMLCFTKSDEGVLDTKYNDISYDILEKYYDEQRLPIRISI